MRRSIREGTGRFTFALLLVGAGCSSPEPAPSAEEPPKASPAAAIKKDPPPTERVASPPTTPAPAPAPAPAITATLDGTALAFKKVTAEWKTNKNYMRIYATNGDDAVTPFNWEALRVSFGGAPGSYDCADRVSAVGYSTPDVGRDLSASGGEGTNCSIVVSEVGPVGGRVKGTYSATIAHNGDGAEEHHRIEGSFDVVRGPDDNH